MSCDEAKMALKFALVGLAGFVLGIVAVFFWLSQNSTFKQQFQALHTSFSSDNKDWTSFSEWLEAGGRAYWRSDTAANGIQPGMTETEIRSVLGAPDLVVVGNEDYTDFATKHPMWPTAFRSRDEMHLNGQFWPYLGTKSKGVYFYKLGRAAYDNGVINYTTLAIKFDAEGRVVDNFCYAVGPDHPLANLSADTRSSRLIMPS
jgi:outer membrane protein assembly factor BamE (lipoprotein component of BamABCDE complex)